MGAAAALGGDGVGAAAALGETRLCCPVFGARLPKARESWGARLRRSAAARAGVASRKGALGTPLRAIFRFFFGRSVARGEPGGRGDPGSYGLGHPRPYGRHGWESARPTCPRRCKTRALCAVIKLKAPTCRAIDVCTAQSSITACSHGGTAPLLRRAAVKKRRHRHTRLVGCPTRRRSGPIQRKATATGSQLTRRPPHSVGQQERPTRTRREPSIIMGAGEGKGRFRKAVAKTTLLRQMSSKVLPLTNPEARLSSEDLRRKKQGSMRAQIKQRATGRVQVTDLYFSMLDMSWGTMLSYCVLAYVCTVALWACITLAAANDIDGSALSLSDKPFVRSLAFACENIVTMGWGQMEPRSGAAFAMGVLQHLTGLALNVLVFAIVCTKFQHPQSQLVFGDRACIVKRRGVPYLLIRLGNKRCNLIYHPDAKLSLLTPVSTPEGESHTCATKISRRPNRCRESFTA